MTHYYPLPTRNSLLTGPVGLAALISVPAIRRPDALFWCPLLFAVTFWFTFWLWRRYFRVEVSDDAIRGRNPETGKWTELYFTAITNAAPTEFFMGRVPGWSFEGAGGKAVFINSGALTDERIASVIRVHTQPNMI